MADDGARKRGLLGNKDEALAPGLETAARNHFPGGTSVVRCELVLGARGCDEASSWEDSSLLCPVDLAALPPADGSPVGGAEEVEDGLDRSKCAGIDLHEHRVPPAHGPVPQSRMLQPLQRLAGKRLGHEEIPAEIHEGIEIVGLPPIVMHGTDQVDGIEVRRPAHPVLDHRI